MSRRAKVAISLFIFLALALLLLLANPRIPLSSSTILQFAARQGYYYIAATQLALLEPKPTYHPFTMSKVIGPLPEVYHEALENTQSSGCSTRHLRTGFSWM